jgi:hypothetical protein
MSLKLNSSGGGSVTLQEPSTASNVTLTLPDNTGTILTTGTAGVPVNGPAFSAYRNSNQTLSTSTATKITFVAENFDTNSNFTSDRFTPTVAGYYQINFTCYFTGANSSGLCYAAIYKNGALVVQSGRLPCNASVGNPVITVSDLIYCNGSTDYIEFYGFQNSGVNSDVGNYTVASGSLVRAA